MDGLLPDLSSETEQSSIHSSEDNALGKSEFAGNEAKKELWWSPSNSLLCQ